MESINNIVCPVCTLFLRPGMTLENHLTSHPKQKVIEALIKLSQVDLQSTDKLSNNGIPAASDLTVYPQLNTSVSAAPTWNHPTQVNVSAMPPNLNQVPTNHSFIYQQFMSSSGTQPVINVNPMAQQFVAVPTVINPQMFCSPYVFQQQQQLQILSSSPNMQSMIQRPPIGLINNHVPVGTSASTSSNNTSNSSPKHVLVASNSNNSSPMSSPSDKIENNMQNNDKNVNQVHELNKEEAIIVYPDMYADTTQMEIVYIKERSESPEIMSAHGKTDDCISDTEKNEIEDNIEVIATINVSNVSDEVIISSEIDVMENISKQWNPKPDNDLNKACQTSQPTVFENICNDNKKIDASEEEDINESNFCTNNDAQSSDHDIHEIYEKPLTPENEQEVSSGIYNFNKDQNASVPSSSNILQNSENVTILEIDDMNFMIANDFIQNGKTILSKVDDYECLKDDDENQILMSIGEEKCNLELDQKNIKKYCEEKNGEESMSRESLNIHADERMPPRGELSEQESNGASDITWGKVYQEQECSSGMSTSYDLLARESWEASDCSDSEMPPLQSRVPPSTPYCTEKETELLIITSKNSPPVTFSCTTCGESFSCPKERRVHQSKEHATSSNSGSTKKTNKTRRKQKETIVKVENNFDLFAKTEPIDDPLENEMMPSVKEEKDVPDEIKTENLLCNMCGELCPTLKEFNKHLQKVHKITNQKHKCKTCQEMFPSEGKFTEHLKIHPLECTVCGKNFYRRYNLYIHLKRHYNIRPFKCETCSKGFLTKQKLQEHNNVHTRNAPIKCTMCDETFRRHSNLVQHRNKHHYNIKKKYKDYVCHCGEVFHSKNKLSWHKEIHDTKPKACTYCHEKFVHMSSLTRHIRRSHNQNYIPKGKKDTENVECHICKGVYFKSSLEVHLQTHSGRRQHACLICGKEFTTKWNLKLHRWTHASRTSKPFKCDQCNGAFIRQADYQAHMNSHKSVRPYTCNYCGCKFIRKYNCQRHVREHEENKSYTCTVCNKSFHRSYYLKEHMRVHSGARPFACHICGKTSTTKSNHNKHMKIHHAREPVSTEG